MRVIGCGVLLATVAISTSAAAAAGANGSGTRKIKCNFESHIQRRDHQSRTDRVVTR
jgi:hypothetical protein